MDTKQRNNIDASSAFNIFRSWWTMIALFVIIIGQITIALTIASPDIARFTLIIWSILAGSLSLIGLYIRNEKNKITNK